MPELPEVEAARRALQAHCVGRRIARCAVADDAKVVVAAAGRAAFERAMVGRTIVAARRRGKNLWLQLDAPPFPSFQFGQSARTTYYWRPLKLVSLWYCYSFGALLVLRCLPCVLLLFKNW